MPKPKQLAPTYARQDNQSEQDKHQREYNWSNQPDASIVVSQNWRAAEQSKCGRHQPAVFEP